MVINGDKNVQSLSMVKEQGKDILNFGVVFSHFLSDPKTGPSNTQNVDLFWHQLSCICRPSSDYHV